MPAGRKPKPTAIKQLEGNPGKRPLNTNEPNPQPASDLKPPRGRLSKHARRLWNEMAPILEAMRLLSEVDLAAFELLCNHYGFAVEAGEILRKEGLVVKEPAAFDDDGNPTAWKYKKNPAAQIFRENAVAFRMVAGEFGLTPSSRARLDVDPPEKEKSLADELFDLVKNG